MAKRQHGLLERQAGNRNSVVGHAHPAGVVHVKEEGAGGLAIEFANDSALGQHDAWFLLLPVRVPPLAEHVVIAICVGSQSDVIHFRKCPTQVEGR